MKYRWDEFLKEGEILYNYMINNFENMFDKSIIKHFDIIDEYYGNINYGEKVYNIYAEDIQKELIHWIKKEKQSGKLFDSTFWKPIRDYNLVDMYYGYKKLFQFEHYYFQLAMESYCELIDCKYCNDKDDITPHFCLSIYGWKEDNYNKLKPWNVNIPVNNIVSDIYWNSE